MSYDFSFGEPAVDSGGINGTSNVAGMWHLAMGIRIADLHGERCRKVARYLKRGIDMFEDYPEAFKAMNPKNGWGDSCGALKVLKELLMYCRSHPEQVLKIHM